MNRELLEYNPEEIQKLRREIEGYMLFSMRSDTDVRNWGDERKEVMSILNERSLERGRELFEDYCKTQIDLANKMQELEDVREEWRKAENKLLRYLF
jgi:hypothetical protein